MEIKEFLQTVITAKSGYFCLCFGTGQVWREEWYKWPDQIDDIIEYAQANKDVNIYFSSYLFKEPQSTKANVIPTKTIQADLDSADISKLPMQPTVLVESSPERHQAYWVLKKGVDLDTHEILSRKITYAIPLCDRSGWPLGRKLRLPGTLNHKYLDGPKPVTIKYNSGRQYDANDIELLPDVPPHAEIDLDWIESDIETPDIGPQELLESIRDRVPPKVYSQYNVRAKDRSESLWSLMCASFRAGLNREQVFFLSRNSANNKFADLRYNADRELAKDVLRAEATVKTRAIDIRTAVLDARKLAGLASERRNYIFSLVLGNMKAGGEFIRTTDDNIWYIRRDLGRPISITPRSEYLDMILDLEYGLNSTETEQSYTVASLSSYARSLPPTAVTSSLSYYDSDSNSLLLHTGKKDILHISKSNINKVVDGSFGVVFPWSNTGEPFMPSFVPLHEQWYDIMFGSGLTNILVLTHDEALVLLRTWFMFLLFRTIAISRPILALFGQPGCISEDTILDIRRGDHSSRQFTAEHLYISFHGRWDYSIPTRILSSKSGTIQWRDIRDVIYSGKKVTYTVIVDGCKPFRVTKDHRFLTPTGYKKLEELSVGDEVMVKGLHPNPPSRTTVTKRIVRADLHPYAQRKMVNGYGPYGNILYCRAVLEADLNGLTIEEYLRIVHYDLETASKLKYLPENVHIHHRDENPSNDSLGNLVVGSKLEHDIYHGTKNVVNLKEFSGIWNESVQYIIAIEYYGEEETYDIEMADSEAPNFLINDVIVHNSGKSTLFRKIYALLYGRTRSIGAVTSPDNFDYSVSSDPLVVLDNVDTWEKWLPDRLALSASTSDITKRKLYTDNDVVVLKRQALIGLTAHNPRFGREDVTDRLILLTFERLAHFEPEGQIIENILNKRNQLWGAIALDVQRVLHHDMPPSEIIPQFRVEDFARVGYWIAQALGYETCFVQAISKVSRSQKTFNLEEELMLVNALYSLCKRQPQPAWRSAGNLWSELSALSRDSQAFERTYKNAVYLSKKLWAMQDTLKEAFDIKWKVDTNKGSRVWMITEKEVENIPIGV